MSEEEQRASFTIFEDADGYWFVPSKSEADPATVSKPSEPSYTTKIAACRAALEIAVIAGATELHLFGMGSTTTIKKEAQQKGIKSFVYWPSIRSQIAPFARKAKPSAQRKQMVSDSGAVSWEVLGDLTSHDKSEAVLQLLEKLKREYRDGGGTTMLVALEARSHSPIIKVRVASMGAYMGLTSGMLELGLVDRLEQAYGPDRGIDAAFS